MNICHFIPIDTDKGTWDILNFVLETQPQTFSGLKTEAVYKLHFVRAGQGKLHTLGKITPIGPGDLFFTFPAEAYAIESVDTLEYQYITFLGSRGLKLMEQQNISRLNCVFSGHSGLKTFWQNAIEMNSPHHDLCAESVLLYTFAHLAQVQTEQKSLLKGQAWAQVKKYLDDHFTDHTLCLRTLGETLGYNPKYLSTVFKQNVGMGITEYLSSLRIQHSCTLIAQGFTSVGDISAQSGFTDPQYFSKVFKSHMGLTPGQYIKEQK